MSNEEKDFLDKEAAAGDGLKECGGKEPLTVVKVGGAIVED